MMKVRKISCGEDQVVIHTREGTRKTLQRGSEELQKLWAQEDLIHREALYEQYRQEETRKE